MSEILQHETDTSWPVVDWDGHVTGHYSIAAGDKHPYDEWSEGYRPLVRDGNHYRLAANEREAKCPRAFLDPSCKGGDQSKRIPGAIPAMVNRTRIQRPADAFPDLNTNLIAIGNAIEGNDWDRATVDVKIIAIAQWMRDGPKILRLTEEQCKWLEEIEVHLGLADYAQPYPCVLVELPPGRYEYYRGCLLHSRPVDGTLTVASTTAGGKTEDEGFIIINQTGEVEDYLCHLDVVGVERLVARVAINACLSLMHFGHLSGWDQPKAVENDRRLAEEDTSRGERARQRLALAVLRLEFQQEITLRSHGEDANGRHREAIGEKSPHWRRACWAMQRHGPSGSLRKRILRRPTLVRADLFIGSTADTSTSYRGRD